MASSLIPNHFYVATAPRSNLYSRSQRQTVFAKTADNSSSVDNSNTFRFDLPKLADVQSLFPSVVVPSTGLSLGFQQRRKDLGTVFVAGATGQVGIRIAQTLLRQGLTVRAGVPVLKDAQELARLAAQYKVLTIEESRRLNAVGSTFDDTESIAKAIGNAGKVVVTIGPTENGPTSEVTLADALRVIQGAELAKVGHIVIVVDDSGSIASTYNVLDGITSFFSNIFSKSSTLTLVEFLQTLVETDLNYTLIKTKLTEDFSPESSYSIAVVSEGSTGANDNKVARSQIASLVAQILSNTSVAENKVVEVYSDPSSLSKSIDELFRDIPEDSRRKVYAKAKAEEEAASKVEEKEEESGINGVSVEDMLSKAKSMNLGLSWDEISSRIQSTVSKSSIDEQQPKVEVATVRGRAKARSLPSFKAVVKGKGKQTEVKKETRKASVGWFKQETIFVDED